MTDWITTLSVIGATSTALWILIGLVESLWIRYENARTRPPGGDR